MVLISQFPDLLNPLDGDFFLIERPGQEYYRLSWIQLKALLGNSIQPTVQPVARYRADAVTHTNGAISSWGTSIGAANNLIPQRDTIFLINQALASKAVVRLAGNAFLQSSNNFSNIREVFVVCNHRETGSSFADFRRLIDFGDNPGSLFGVSGTTNYSPRSFPRNINASSLRINGRLTDSAAPLANYRLINFQFENPVSNRLWVGTYSGVGAQLFLGDIADVLLFDTWLDVKEKFAWQTVLMADWGING
jgi:hypothetical protein